MKLNYLYLLILFLGCSTPEPLGGRAYAGVAVGNYAIYLITKVSYEPTEAAKMQKFWQKQEVIKQIDPYHFTLQFASKNNYTNSWTLDSSRIVELSPEQYFTHKKELAFPLNVNKNWDVHKENITVKRLLDKYTIKDKTYEQVYEIGIKTDSSLINISRLSNYYAKNIGLISSFEKRISYCQDANCIGKYQPESGFELEKILIEYGKN